MKKMLLTLLLALTALSGAKAMSYEEARTQARFLTDKMAYELNLNDAQYNDAYEINLDYLMGIQTADDVYGTYLTYRNADLRCILYDWQYALFTAADYFFHPVYWRGGAWVFPIYTRYRVDVFYYGHPRVFWEYRGAHCRMHYPRASFYANRRPAWTGGFRGESRRPVTHPGNVGGVRPNGGARPGNSATRPGGVNTRPGSGNVKPGQSTSRPTTGGQRTGNAHTGTTRTTRSTVGGSTRSTTTRSIPSGTGSATTRSQSTRTGTSTRTGSGNSYQRQSSTRTTVSRGSSTPSARQTGTRTGGSARSQSSRK